MLSRFAENEFSGFACLKNLHFAFIFEIHFDLVKNSRLTVFFFFLLSIQRFYSTSWACSVSDKKYLVLLVLVPLFGMHLFLRLAACLGFQKFASDVFRYMSMCRMLSGYFG